MDKDIRKAIISNQLIDLIYLASNGVITKRRVKPIKIESDSFMAYCFLRRSTRTFKVNQVLACAVVINKEPLVI